MAYYDGLWGRSSSLGVFSSWCRYENGIFAGCPISVILFLAAFNVLIEYVGDGDMRKYVMSNGNSIETLRGFMDDLSNLSPSVPVANIALRRTEVAVGLASMKLKPAKSMSVVIHRGKVMNVEPF